MPHKTNFLQRPLDWIFSAPSNIAVIRALKDNKEGMSGRAVARAAGFTHQACRQALSKLEAMGIIVRQGSARTQLIRLNFDHVLVRDALLPLLRAEKHMVTMIRKSIRREFEQHARSATLFGSVARKEDEPGSDLDILLIADGKDKSRLLDKAHDFGNRFTSQYGIRLSPMVVTVREAHAKHQRPDPLFKNILSHGIDLLDERLKDILS